MTLEPALVERLYRQADAARWHLSLEHFSRVLAASAEHGAGTLTGSAPDHYLSALHLQDLALACACSLGDDAAWEHFVGTHRPSLYRAADAIDPSGGARELADSLYGELYGLRERDGERQSLFRYFHGRSSLSTWLRSVLAQRHVDRHRSQRRLEPLPEDESASATRIEAPALDPDRNRALQLVQRSLTRAVASLDARDRLRLACYYARDMTLAQTGRLLAEHEATTSRQLARTRKAIRADVERQLRHDHNLSEADVSRCFQSVAEDAGPLDLRQMLAIDPERKEPALDRSR